jgi:peroxiredoxin/predicted 2-oxoglutarate/Fe(II)-dependent dioxygenase YbiX
MHFVNLRAGDPAPWFVQRASNAENFKFDTVGGRYILLGFFVTAGEARTKRALSLLETHRGLFDDKKLSFFGVSNDPKDEAEKRVEQQAPGIRYFWDFDGRVAKAYGVLPQETQPEKASARPLWFLLDPALRVMAVLPITEDGAELAKLGNLISTLPPPGEQLGFPVQAPVLVLPGVFEPGFCKHLIDLYEKHGGEDSGFMREVDGKTVLLTDHGHKRRSDYMIDDENLIKETQARFQRRVVPEIKKAYQYNVTRMERYIVACYDSVTGGHFNAHRDNTTKGTAHRRFAVSVNLNATFEGGEVSFPEFGPRGFKMPPGAAVVFSCSLLHQVSAVTSGKRYAFLPFLYDDEAAKVREANNQYLGEGVGAYKQA